MYCHLKPYNSQENQCLQHRSHFIGANKSFASKELIVHGSRDALRRILAAIRKVSHPAYFKLLNGQVSFATRFCHELYSLRKIGKYDSNFSTWFSYDSAWKLDLFNFTIPISRRICHRCLRSYWMTLFCLTSQARAIFPPSRIDNWAVSKWPMKISLELMESSIDGGEST